MQPSRQDKSLGRCAVNTITVFCLHDWDPFYEVYGPNTIGLGTRLSNWLDEEMAWESTNTQTRYTGCVEARGPAF